MKLLHENGFLTGDPFVPGPASLLSIIQKQYPEFEQPIFSKVWPGEFTGDNSKGLGKYKEDFQQ